MRSTLRTSTALIASLSLVMGHLPLSAIAQEFDASQCEEGEDEDTCLARLMEEAAAAETPAAEAEAETPAAEAEAEPADPEAEAEAAAAEEAARLAAEEAERLAAEEEAARQASEAAAAEEAARAEAEAAAAEEAARLAAEEAARLAAEEEAARLAEEEAARLAEEEAARQAAEEDAATAEALETPATEAPATEADAAAEEAPAPGETTAEEGAAEGVTAETDTADAPAGDETAEGTAPATEGDAQAAEESASQETPTEDAATAADPATDEDALAEALEAAGAADSEGELADTLIVAPEEITSEEAAALEAALLAADAAELAAAAPVDPVAEAEAEVASAEAEAAEAQQSLALAPDAEPVAGAVEEVITEESARQSDEDFGRLLTATTESDDDRDRTGLTGTQGLILGGLGGLAIGAIIAGNRQVVNRADDRLVVLRPEGDYQVIRDDDSLLRRPGNRVFTESFADGSSRNVITEPDGTQVITVRDRDLRILRRTVVNPDGTRIVLIDDMAAQRPVVVSELPQVRPATSFVSLEAAADAEALARALQGQTGVDRGFSLGQIRSIRAVRDLAPAVNLETVTFETGSAAISSDQASQLLALGRYMSDAIARNPREVFLIEGHTDATGAASFNLGLSDRRAETVALALTEYFGVRPQNMVIQGYGEEFLLIPTLENERLNRRVAVRRITDLLRVAAME